ncbi:phospholipase A2 inhibitor NAI-like [Eublepharis macularius]|uniref:Phospholipase A2 inhibitor NAI-like n=1 Tax=Eublepharis macularius TaxID=481883 RepID=A0AA97KGC8_EUBMA|nr:phospholipase A2 inhibitor NAI-like [Eublepharis macularius]
MPALLRLFFFSVLLTTVTSLECEICSGPGNSCSGQKVTCPSGQDTCLSLVIETSAGGQTVTAISKTCNMKDACAQLKPGASFDIAGVSGNIKEVACNKALPTSRSILLIVTGLLLLKVLF